MNLFNEITVPSFEHRPEMDMRYANPKRLWKDNLQNLLFCEFSKKKYMLPAWNRDAYNGSIHHAGYTRQQNKMTPELSSAMAGLIQDELEEVFHENIDMVAIGIKTIDAKNFAGIGNPVEKPKYDPKGRASAVNIIYYNKQTGKYCALPQWVGVGSYDSTRMASTASLTDFYNQVTTIDGPVHPQMRKAIVDGIKAQYSGDTRAMKFARATKDAKAMLATAKHKVQGMFR